MQKNRIIISVSILFFQILLLKLTAQTNTTGRISVEQYIETYKDVAVAHMHTYGIPASIKLAQGILESAFGNSELAVNANNHFGIKCHNWQGETYHKDDDEKDECFRKYNDPLSSFVDHSEFLTTRARYASLFELDITDYKAWARGLRAAGYATNPRYPELLINIIERNKLYEFDNKKTAQTSVAVKEKPAKDVVKPKEIKPAVVSTKKREIKLNNRIKYIAARTGDTPESIAAELEMGAWQIYRYNELERGAKLKENQTVYLQPKRRRSFEHDMHIVIKGETLYDISQKYGVKMRHLLRLNPDMHPDGIVNQGQRVALKRGLFDR